MLPTADSSRKQLAMSIEAAFGVPTPITAQNITGATNASPIVITIAGHGLSTGQWMDIASVGGNTNANGNWQIQVLSADTFALLGSQGNSAYTSGGTATPAAKYINFTEESLKFEMTRKRSGTTRADRQLGPSRTVDQKNSGTIKQQLQYKESDAFLSMALQNVWDVYGVRGVGAVFTGTVSGGNTITAGAAPSGASAFTKLKKGQWVLCGGQSDARNNVVAQISKTTAPTSTVLVFEGTPFAANGSMGAACTIASSRLTNGTLQMSAVMERQFTDITQIFPMFGMMLDQLQLDMDAGDFLYLTHTFTGKTSTAAVAATTLATPAAAQTFDDMDGITGVSRLQRNGTTLTESVMKMSITLANALRAKKALGSLGAAGMGSGSVDVKGSQEAYLQDGTRFNLSIANTPFSITVAALDANNNGYIFTLPRARFEDANPSGGGMNQDVSDPGSFTAEADSTQTAGSGYDKTIFIDRVGVAV